VQPGANLDAGGPGQDYVRIGTSGNIGMVTVASTDNGITTETTSTPAAPSLASYTAVEEKAHFRIQRTGSVLRNGSILRLYYRLGLDVEWTEAEMSPLTRLDMDNLVLEVGIYQISTVESTAVVDDFSISSELIFISGFD